jgi:single-stranded DNA-binding protein
MLTNFVVATNEVRGGGAAERTEYHNLVAWARSIDNAGN